MHSGVQIPSFQKPDIDQNSVLIGTRWIWRLPSSSICASMIQPCQSSQHSLNLGQKSSRNSSNTCSVCLHPQGGSDVFVGGQGSRSSPLCKQLTPAVMEGRGQARSPCFPGTAPQDWRRRRREQEEEEQRPEQIFLDSICRLLPTTDKGDGDSQDRWVHPHQLVPSIWLQPGQLSCLLITDISKPALSLPIFITSACCPTLRAPFSTCNPADDEC